LEKPVSCKIGSHPSVWGVELSEPNSALLALELSASRELEKSPHGDVATALAEPRANHAGT
jgi:hypothetical protein